MSQHNQPISLKPKETSAFKPIPTNKINLSPSTTHNTTTFINNKPSPFQKDSKNHHQPLLIKPLPLHLPNLNPEEMDSLHDSSLNNVRTNLLTKFTNASSLNNLFSLQNYDSNHSHCDLISSSNSQSSLSNDEKSLIENLMPNDMVNPKKKTIEQGKKVTFEGNLELTNEHTGITDSFKTYKEEEVYVSSINDNLLLHEEEDEVNCSDEDVLTKSTQSVLIELFEAIDYVKKKKQTKAQDKDKAKD